jgi:uncharacterized protein (TIRG00374 family)
MKNIIIGSLTFVSVIVLLYWALQDVPFIQIKEVLSNLSFQQLLILMLVNAGIMLLFSLRWWLILSRQNLKVAYLNLSLYKLASFGVSYFTPGPHFGGEPLQVLFLRQRHKIETAIATTSVALDKLIELISNLAFLVYASFVVFLGGEKLFSTISIHPSISLVLLVMPLIYLASIWRGGQPLSRLVSPFNSLQSAIQRVESSLTELITSKPRLLAQGLLASVFVWVALILEYQLALNFLGLELNFVEILTIILFARLAMLTPTPGALGALEAALVIAFNLVNLEPAHALSLAILIRARDILFGGIGLIIAASYGFRSKSAS